VVYTFEYICIYIYVYIQVLISIHSLRYISIDIIYIFSGVVFYQLDTICKRFCNRIYLYMHIYIYIVIAMISMKHHMYFINYYDIICILAWYSISFIPFARDFVKAFLANTCCGCLKDQSVSA
jgi:hypothetical protein